MSAVPALQPIRLQLTGKRPWLRNLAIELSDKALSVSTSLPGKMYVAPTISFSTAEPRHCYLLWSEKYKSLSPSLWIGGTSFDLSQAEAEAVIAHFEPHGLRVER